MKLSQICKLLENEFPIDTAWEFDNVGLLLGDPNRDIKKVLLTLDVNEAVASEAIENGVDLILSHHPIMFDSIKKITTATPEGRIILKLLENQIAMYAAHTNCDVAKNGINSYLAKLFNLCDIEYVEEDGLGRIGNLSEETDFFTFAKQVKNILNTPSVRISGENRTIKRIAVGSGACADIIPTAIQKGADVIITGDMKYHDMMLYTQSGINIIDAGHYPTEIVVMDIFEELLKSTGIEMIKSKNPDIFSFI